MMTEEGKIIKISGNKAWVLAHRSSACESCSNKDNCSPFGGDGKEIEIEAINTINGEIGNRVIVSLESSSVIKVALIVYMFPIFMLLAGVYAGTKIAPQYSLDVELCALFTGFSFFVITFLVIKLISNRLSNRKEYMPQIIKIIS